MAFTFSSFLDRKRSRRIVLMRFIEEDIKQMMKTTENIHEAFAIEFTAW